MKHMDFLPQPSRESERIKREVIREHFFHELVAAKILDRFIDDLDDAGISEKDLQEIINAFSSQSEEDKKTLLAIPAVLRPAMFKKLVADFEGGVRTPSQAVADLLELFKKERYTLGFHLSNADIRPSQKADDWKIYGREPDHRHNDLPMAYYSLDYKNRYRAKPSRYLYVVRIEKKPDSGHYQDNDGAWGHAPTLAIIDQIDMLELEQELDARMRDTDKSKEGDAQSISL